MSSYQVSATGRSYDPKLALVQITQIQLLRLVQEKGFILIESLSDRNQSST